MLDHTTFTWINPPLSYQELSSQALGKGVLKSLGIPTPRNPRYQVLAIPICLSPHVFQVTDYLADLDFCSNTLHTLTTIE
jgi:hypothetical protein